jgi:hypothetical protein
MEKEELSMYMIVLSFTNINLIKYSIEQDIELCALKLPFNSVNICVLTTIYKAPAGNMNSYTHKIDAILCTLCTATLDFITCGDISINYPIDNARKIRLDTQLFSYNLSDIIKFPAKVQKNSVSAIDNIFIAVSRMGNCTVIPVVNG